MNIMSLIMSSEGIMDDRNAYRPKAFICYRGISSNSNAGLEIAETVYDYLQDHKEFAPVFFAQKNNFTYNFINDAESIVKGVSKFIIILSKNFFSGFYTVKDGKTIINQQSSTCLELYYAIKYNVTIYPIFSSEFHWDDVSEETTKHLCEIFGEENFNNLTRV